jgi:hypothetical protein
MAIKISNTTVIDDARNIVNVPNANYTGIVTASSFVANNTALPSRGQVIAFSLVL